MAGIEFNSPRAQLEQFLTSDQLGNFPLEGIKKLNLASYAYRVLPEDHPARAHFKSDYINANLRHQMLRKNLSKLLKAWSEVGIEVLLFKGFALSEFEYPSPGMRFHGDVDLLIHPKDLDIALEIALEQNMSIAGHHSLYLDLNFHELAALMGPDGTLRIDIHRYPFHPSHINHFRSKQATEMIWKNAREMDFDGTKIKIPSPEDCLLIGLILNRWFGNQFSYKTHDYLDAKLLIGKYKISLNDIEKKAAALKCTITLKSWLSNCNPWEQRLNLAPKTPLEKFSNRVLLHPEISILYRDKNWVRIRRAPLAFLDLAREFPLVYKVIKAIDSGIPMDNLLTRFFPPIKGPKPSKPILLAHHLRGIRLALKIIGRGHDACVPRSISLLYRLRQEGVENLSFVSGVRNDGNGVEGHAWVEINGNPITGEESSKKRFKELYRFPKVETNS